MNVIDLTRAQLQKEIEVLWEASKINCINNQDFLPMLFCFTKDKSSFKLSMMGLSIDNDRDKAARVIKEIIEKFDAKAIFLVTEAWYVHTRNSKEEDINKIIPSEHEDKKEALIGHFETSHSNTMYLANIQREGNSKIIQDEQVIESELQGRFAGFL